MLHWMLGSVSVGDVLRGMLDMSTRWHGGAPAMRMAVKTVAILCAGLIGWTLTGSRGETLAIALIATLSLFGAGKIYRSRG